MAKKILASEQKAKSPELLEQRISAIVVLCRQSCFSEAENAAKDLVKKYPNHPFGWKVLGMICADQHRHAEAEKHLKKSARLSPKDAEALGALGNLMASTGRHGDAIPAYLQAIAVNPDWFELYNNVATSYRALQKYDKAVEYYEKAIALEPEFALAHFNIALTYQENINDPEKALEHYQLSVKYNPVFAIAYYNAANVLKQMGRLEEAINCYRISLEHLPDDPDVYYNLGNALKDNCQPEEAIKEFCRAIALKPDFVAAHSLKGHCHHVLGDPNAAFNSYTLAVQHDPRHASTFNQLGLLMHDVGEYQQAVAYYAKALSIEADIAEVWNNMGNALNELGNSKEAAANFECAIALKPTLAEAYNNLSAIYRDWGYIERAVEKSLCALQLNVRYKDAYDNLLFCINYHPGMDGAELYRYYQEFESKFGQPLQKTWRPHGNDRNAERRLRVGYVSPAFGRHSVRHFLEPLLSKHDRARFELYAYAQIVSEDDTLARYQSYVDHWINTRGMSDEQLAERIRLDRIDILVDLAGHTGHNRLLVFARKPAPVSLHWLDFGYTTGLKAIDYYLGDPVITPKGCERFFSERIWRLPATSYVYRPEPGTGHVAPLPAASKGYVTFGTLTRSVRINDRVVRVWSEILKRIPTARLSINSSNFKDEAMQSWLAERFAARGIARDRLEIGYQSPAWAALQQTDITLDCFPHNSGTTLYESLYMGVPYITLASRPSVGTLGASVLTAAGHPEWIARNETEYIEKAVQLAQDSRQLGLIRAGLRQQMQRSALMDEPGFARAVEHAYRQMWHGWCHAPAAIPGNP